MSWLKCVTRPIVVMGVNVAHQVHTADPRKVEDAIRCGGLAETKAKRIVDILDTIFKERGSICLEYVRSMTVDQIKAELSRFKGVGPKTVRMALLYLLY